MAMLANHEKLSATWYTLEETERPIGEFVANRVPLVPLFAHGAADVFFPSALAKRGVSRYPPKRQRRDDAPAGSAGDAPEADDQDLASDADPDDEDMGPDGLDKAPGDLAEMMDAIAAELLQPLQPPDEDEAQGSAASGAVNAPDEPSAPCPPPPPEPEAPAGPRGKANVTVVFPWGKISYYASKQAFEAICRNPRHGTCVLTRAARAKAGKSGERFPGGRPIGFMAAWLQQGQVASKQAHWAPEVLEASHAARRAGRRFVKDAHNGPQLLGFERPKMVDAGENFEPEDLAPYV